MSLESIAKPVAIEPYIATEMGEVEEGDLFARMGLESWNYMSMYL